MKKTVSIVKACEVGSGELAVEIPKEARKELGVKEGKKFLVKISKASGSYRLIYEPVE